MKLSFLAKGTAMVPDYGAMRGGTRRFKGWTHNPNLGADRAVVDTAWKPTGGVIKQGAFLKKVGVEHAFVVYTDDAHLGEYMRHARDGDLWPADAATAHFCQVAFDPKFGDEHSDDAKAEHEELLADLAAS